MTIRVLYFAVLKERCGCDQEELPLPQPPTVGSLKRELARLHPFLDNRWGAIRIAVNMEFCGDEQPLTPGDEVALVPPVAGGAPQPGEERVALSREPLSLDRAVAEVVGPRVGGLCVFAGLVRDHHGARTVHSIDYTAYEPMALRKLQQIVEAAEQLHGARIACHHRLGLLNVGEMAVVIAAAAAHRAECFAACRDVIEAIKRDVPIWKEERGEEGGAVWVEMGS